MALQNNEALKKGGFFFTIMLFDLNDRVEIVQPEIETQINLLITNLEQLKLDDDSQSKFVFNFELKEACKALKLNPEDSSFSIEQFKQFLTMCSQDEEIDDW